MPRLAARRDHLERAYRRRLLRLQQERDPRVLKALYNISLTCRERPSFQAIFQAIQAELATVFDFDAAYLAFCDERPEYFKCALLVDEGHVSYIEQVEYGFLTGAIVRTGQPMLYRDLLYERDPDLPRVPFGQVEKRSRAWMGVPLLIGAASIGVISLQSYKVGIYTQATLDLLQRMANVIAVALENVALIEQQENLSRALAAQVAARTEEIRALSEVSAGLVTRKPLTELLDHAIDVVLELFQLDAGNVRLIDENREFLVLYAQRGFSDAYVERTTYSRLTISPIREAVYTALPIVIPDNWRSHYEGIGLPFEVFPPAESSLILPLTISGMVIGTLNLFGLSPRPFEEYEINLSMSIAYQIATIIENARLLDQHERQIAELRALGTISTAALTAPTLETLLFTVRDALQSFVQFDGLTVIAYDHERGVVTDSLMLEEGRTTRLWELEPPPANSLTAHILATGQVMRFNDLPVELAAYPNLRHAAPPGLLPVHAWLGVPLYDRNGVVIGQMSIRSACPGVFTQRDAQFLPNVAAQIALYLQNMRLQCQRERQIVELEAIGQIGKLVAASYDLDQMLAETYRIFHELIGVNVFALIVCEPETGLITNAAFVEEGEWFSLDLVGQPPPDASMSTWILAQREPLLFQDLLEQREALQRRGIMPQPIGPPNDVRSWAGVPVVARDGELIGVLSIQAYQPYRYDVGTLDFLSQVASYISLGVQKVRLFQERERLLREARESAEAAERQADRMALVHRMASVLSARLDQQEILDLAARELVQLFWADHTGTVILHPDGTGYVAAEYPDMQLVGLQIEASDNPIVQQLATIRRPVVINNPDHDPLAAASRELWRSLGIKALVIVPLISRDRVFGSISLDSLSEPLNFSAEELELMMTVATSIAAAIENAQLFAAEQAQRQTADTLREMTRVLSSSFDPPEVLRLVLDELGKLIAFDTASIMLREGSYLHMVAFKGREQDRELFPFILPLEGSAGGSVVLRNEPLVYIQGEGGAPWLPMDVLNDIRSWLGVPLVARGRVLGVLNIDSRSLDPQTSASRIFTEREIEVARAFANHAALAIENARLYQESITRVEQELEIARKIQLNLFPRELPRVQQVELAARCLPARETGGDFYDVVDLGTRLGIIIGDVSGKSLPAAMLMAVARSTVRSEARNHETPWVVLTETNRWLVDDVPRSSFVAVSYAVVDPQQQRMVLASAGQLTPLRYRRDGTTDFLPSPQSLPLGFSRDTTFSQVEIVLSPGDTLLFYTDGIVEAHDHERNLFGFERLQALLSRWGHLDPEALIDHIVYDVELFSAGMPTHDDMTLLVVRVH